MSEASKSTKGSQGKPLYPPQGSTIRIMIEVRYHDSLLRTNESDGCGSITPCLGCAKRSRFAWGEGT